MAISDAVRHKAAEEQISQLRRDLESEKKLICNLRGKAFVDKKLATEAQDLADSAGEKLKALKATLASQTPVAQDDNAELQNSDSDSFFNPREKLAWERLRNENKNLRNSKEGYLSQQLQNARNKNIALNTQIRLLKAQLADTESTPTPATTPKSPESAGSLSSINFEAFPINNANRTYEVESSRLLEYFRNQSIDLAARAKGITDQGAGGWSAWEQLEKIVTTLAPHNAEAVAKVLELKPELERELRLNSMGFVPWDANGFWESYIIV